METLTSKLDACIRDIVEDGDNDAASTALAGTIMTVLSNALQSQKQKHPLETIQDSDGDILDMEDFDIDDQPTDKLVKW